MRALPWRVSTDAVYVRASDTVRHLSRVEGQLERDWSRAEGWDTVKHSFQLLDLGEYTGTPDGHGGVAIWDNTLTLCANLPLDREVILAWLAHGRFGACLNLGKDGRHE